MNPSHTISFSCLLQINDAKIPCGSKSKTTRIRKKKNPKDLSPFQTMNCSEREPGYVIELFYCIKDIGFVSTKQNHTRFISLIIVSLLGTMPAILRGSGVVDTVDL